MKNKTLSANDADAITASGSVFRPELPGPPDYVGAPVYLRSVGWNYRRLGDDESVPAGEKDFVQVFWGVSGEGEFRPPVRGVPTCRLRPGDVLYRLPGEPHVFAPRTDVWTYRWMTFDGPLARDFMLAYRYPRVSWAGGDCPHGLFASLARWLKLRTPHSWRLMAAGISQILAQAGGDDDGPKVPGPVLAAVGLCKERFADPDLNVNALAAEIGVTRTTLLRAFRRHMRQSPSDYLAQVRLQEALARLGVPDKPVKRVARECGFHDINYFCRFLKQRTGMRPTELREKGIGC